MEITYFNQLIIEPFILLICFVVLIIGSITDLRTREVPDWINYGLMFCGFGIAIILSLTRWDYSYILRSALGFGIFFVIAYIMFYTGQWGGGDSKMIMGLGAIIGINYHVTDWVSSKVFINGLPFLVNFIIYSVIFGAIYGLIWSSALAIINRKKFYEHFVSELKNPKMQKIKWVLLGITIIGLITLFLIPQNIISNTIKILILSLIMIVLLSYYMLIYIRTIENVCMIKSLDPEKLTEGDWIYEEVKVGKKIICGPKDLGIEKEQIAKLIKLKELGKINQVIIKEGIPFVPSFLIAFIVCIIFGSDLFFIFL